MLAARRTLTQLRKAAGFPATSGAPVGDGSGNFVVTKPAGTVNGNVILVLVQYGFSFTHTLPAGFSTLQYDGSAVHWIIGCFTKIASSEPSSWTFGAVPGENIGWTCLAVPGSAVDSSAVAVDTTTSPTVTTTHDGCYIVTMGGEDRNNTGITFTGDAACSIDIQQGTALLTTMAMHDTVNQVTAGPTTARSLTNSSSTPNNLVTVAVTPASAYDNAVLADTPVGFWPLKEASGTTAHDLSGNGNDGTLSGSFALGATGIGDGETACNFTGGKLTIPDAAPIRIGAASFTVECFINLSALSGLTALWDRAELVYSMILNDGGGNGVAFYAGHGALNERTLSITLTTSTLYHFVYVLDSSGPTATIYVNGTSRYSGSVSQGATNSANGIMFCGSDGAFGAAPAQGVGSKFALYDRALTPTQVATHYAAA